MSRNNISEFAFVSPIAKLGSGNTIMENVIIRDNVKIGNNNIIYPGCVIGEPGEYIGKTGRQNVHIGDNNTFREHVVIQGSVLSALTIIQNNCYIMDKTHIAHDCVLCDNVIIAPLTSLGGSVILGSFSNLGQGVIIHPNVKVGEGAMLGCNATIVKDVPKYETWASPPPSRKIGYNLHGLKKRGYDEYEIEALINKSKQCQK